MRSVRWLSLFAFVSSFGAVGLAATTASAAPCCSAPMCQREYPPSWCDICNPNCSVDEETFVEGEIVYDEAAGLCYEAGDLEPTPCEEIEADGELSE